MKQNALGGYIPDIAGIGAEARHPAFGAGTLCPKCGEPMDGRFEVVVDYNGVETPALPESSRWDKQARCAICFGRAVTVKMNVRIGKNKKVHAVGIGGKYTRCYFTGPFLETKDAVTCKTCLLRLTEDKVAPCES